MTSKLNFLKSLDILSYQHGLYFENNSSYLTVLGGSLTMVLGILFVTLMSVLGTGVFAKKNPIVNYSQVNVEESRVYLSELAIMISINSNDDKSLLKNDDFLEVLSFRPYTTFVVYDEQERDYTTKRYSIEQRNCTRDMFVDEYFEQFKEVDFSRFTCLVPYVTVPSGERRDIYVQNKSNDANAATVGVEMSLCRDDRNEACFRKARQFPNFKVTTWFNTQYFDDSDRYAFIRHRTYKMVTIVDLTSTTVETVSIKQTTVKEDEGLIFTSTNSMKYNSVSNVKTEVTSKDTDYYEFMSLVVESPRLQDVVSVRYMKLQELLANINALTKVVLIPLNVISRMTGKHAFLRSIGNRIKKPQHAQDSNVVRMNRGDNQTTQVSFRKEPSFREIPGFFKFWVAKLLCCKREQTLDLEVKVAKILSIEAFLDLICASPPPMRT